MYSWRTYVALCHKCLAYNHCSSSIYNTCSNSSLSRQIASWPASCHLHSNGRKEKSPISFLLFYIHLSDSEREEETKLPDWAFFRAWKSKHFTLCKSDDRRILEALQLRDVPVGLSIAGPGVEQLFFPTPFLHAAAEGRRVNSRLLDILAGVTVKLLFAFTVCAFCRYEHTFICARV